MKASKVASLVSALIASDAKPTEAQILAAILAADKKGKDEGGLGNVEIQNKEKPAKDAFPDKDDKAKDADYEKAKDGKDDPEHTNDAEDPDMSEDEKDDKAEDDVQPKVSAKVGPTGKQDEPAKDKKGMDAAGVAALIAANDAKHAAAREVESILGVVAYDSADAYYKAALTKLGVDTAGVHASAFPSLLKLAKDKLDAATPIMASDAARVSTMAGAIKGYNRLK
jgi:uncharacterized protein